MANIVGLFILFEFAGNDISSEGSRNKDTSDTSMRSKYVEIGSDKSNTATTTNQRSHSDLIRICSTFHEILSSNVANSCHYSMLYYKGQCELYSDLLIQNETEAVLQAGNDLSFCLDSRIDEYIQEHNLTNAPRSPTLIPNERIPIA